MTEQHQSSIVPPYVNFQGFPLPEFRFERAKREIIGAQLLTINRKHDRIIKVQFFSSTPGKANDSYEIVGTETHLNAISRLLSENLPHTQVYTWSPYVTLTEIPNGDLLVAITQAGRALLEEHAEVDIFTEAVQGTKVRMTDKREHPSLYPPFTLFDGSLWYYKPAQKNNHAFREDILKNGWVKMVKYSR